MADFTYMGVVSSEWTALERDYPEWFDQTTPSDWTLEDIKSSINQRRAEEAARDAMNYDHVTAITKSIPTKDGSTNDIRIYQFKDSTDGSRKQPVYIHLHGGGFMFGSLAADDPLCFRVASRLRMTVVNINYRHTPEFVYPTPVHDVWDAVQWTFDNLGDYNADLDKVVMGGISAGANLTAATAIMELDQKVKRIKGLLLAAPLCGPSDQQFPPGIISSASISSYVQNANAPVLSRQRVDFFLDNYKAPSKDDRYFNVMKLSDEEIRQLGPSRAYFMICGLDPFRDEGIVWRERLSRCEKRTKMQLYPGLPHGLGLGYVREDVFPPKHRWDNDYIDGVCWLLGLDEE